MKSKLDELLNALGVCTENIKNENDARYIRERIVENLKKRFNMKNLNYNKILQKLGIKKLNDDEQCMDYYVGVLENKTFSGEKAPKLNDDTQIDPSQYSWRETPNFRK